jgi:hypothetical protein
MHERKMSLLVAAREFNPGFRFSRFDAVALFLLLYVCGDMAAVIPPLGIAMGFVVAHFFLFCNLLRMSRSLELTWSGLFLALAGLTILMGSPAWVVTFAISFVATVVLAVVEMRKASYHGVFWQRINPGLPQWWEDRRR